MHRLGFSEDENDYESQQISVISNNALQDDLPSSKIAAQINDLITTSQQIPDLVERLFDTADLMPSDHNNHFVHKKLALVCKYLSDLFDWVSFSVSYMLTLLKDSSER